MFLTRKLAGSIAIVKKFDFDFFMILLSSDIRSEGSIAIVKKIRLRFSYVFLSLVKFHLLREATNCAFLILCKNFEVRPSNKETLLVGLDRKQWIVITFNHSYKRTSYRILQSGSPTLGHLYSRESPGTHFTKGWWTPGQSGHGVKTTSVGKELGP